METTFFANKNESQLRDGAQLQNGTYQIIRVLGQGGFGITYLAYDTRLKIYVAIKEFFPKTLCERDSQTGILKAGTSDSNELFKKLRAKFLKESRNLAKLNHPNIIHIRNSFEENNSAYFVMDYVEGKNLYEIIKENGALSINKAIEYVNKIGKALEYIHDKRINHLDVKPANIMINSQTDEPILIDFGLSKHYDDAGVQTTTTPVGLSHGYAPIEQYHSEGVHEFSPQLDVYSLSATLFFLITGKTPPQATNLISQKLEIPNSVPANLKGVIAKGMASDKRKRYETINQLLKDLKLKKKTKNIVLLILKILFCVLLGILIYLLIKEYREYYSGTENKDKEYPLPGDTLPKNEQIIQVQIADSLRNDSIYRNFTSPDLSFFNVHGRVKSIEYGKDDDTFPLTAHNDHNIIFDKEGKCNNLVKVFYGKHNAKVVRNNEGQVVSMTETPEITDQTIGKESFTWNNNHLVKEEYEGWEWGGEITYSYSDGHISYINYSYTGDFQEEKTSISLTDFKFDEYGNWISCVARTNTTNYNYDTENGEPKITKEPTQTEKVTRKITYYTKEEVGL